MVSGVKLAFRYFTSSWMMLLSTTFLTLISTAVVFMPLFVLNMAIHASNEAAMYGDAVNLPSSVAETLYNNIVPGTPLVIYY